ncbi:MAG: PKD domain-containing protein, partial [Hydrogenothermaceae bacterium]|nr:PKD domain-containing protein [Hydrogenothermaceae bacterium]
TSPSPVWTAPSMERECKITLTVSDGSRSTEISETVKVYDNRPPVISYAYPSKSYVDKNVQVQLYSYAYDPDGDPITYSWSDNCSGSFNDSTSPSPVWTAPSMERECKITLTVSDGEKITQKSFSIKVGNKSPVVSSIRADKVGVPTGGKVELSVSAYDPEGSNLSYKWESSCGGSFNNPESNYTTWTAPDTVAICTIKVTVSDTDGKSSESSISTYVGKEANTEIKIQGKKTNL